MMPDDPQQRRILIIQLALITAIITMIVIVAGDTRANPAATSHSAQR
jgi:hypothetical protein